MATSADLTDAEIQELDELLDATPEPLQPLDAVMLDGYLCGVLAQPRLIEAAEWLPPVFDFDGRRLPASADPEWQQRCEALILRRHATLNRAIVEDGWFEPLIPEPDDDADPPEEWRELPASSIPLVPWVVGFQHAAISFPDLDELDDDAVMGALARLYRHLPPETDEERELFDTLQREQPLATLDDAIDDLVLTIAELVELTSEQRFHVDTVRRTVPKVGRNDPCPCGSGRKFKQCHGAG